MRIGTHINAAGPIGDVLKDAADARGLDSVWTNQLPGGWDPLTVLAGMGDGPAELGTAVVPTHPRHPLALATRRSPSRPSPAGGSPSASARATRR